MPLKRYNRHLELFKIVVIPARIFDNTYVKFVVENYFAVNLLQSTYFAMRGTEILKCKGKDLMICPASQAVYSMEINSCIQLVFAVVQGSRDV